MTVGLTHFLLVAAILFSLGILALATRKNAVMMLMGVELILNSANINLVAFSRYQAMNLDGHLFAIFVIILAAAEAAVALAIVLQIFKQNQTVNADQINKLKE
ncbi:MAG: NADH-quinone oxidoreductase subunit NuoK [Ignavibacteria bacterium]|nr:NADH-quinone oxidoreductase subunit NuoK [Ignavibacteria bacterium]